MRSVEDRRAQAAYKVIVYQAHRLHEGVADGGPDEVEVASLEIFAHGIGIWGSGGDLLHGLGRVQPRLAIYELPNVAIEAAEFLLHRQKCLRVRDGGGDFKFVADYAGIAQELFDLATIVARDLPGSNPAKAVR